MVGGSNFPTLLLPIQLEQGHASRGCSGRSPVDGGTGLQHWSGLNQGKNRNLRERPSRSNDQAAVINTAGPLDKKPSDSIFHVVSKVHYEKFNTQ